VTRRLVVVRSARGGLTHDDPTDADLVAYLRAHPEQATRVVCALRVLGPWEARDRHRHVVRMFGWTDVAEVEQYGVEGEESENWRWKAAVGFAGESSGIARTKAIALACADAALVADGWALASPEAPASSTPTAPQGAMEPA
jgi:hypothetical protein